jgi:hypothetical protein
MSGAPRITLDPEPWALVLDEGPTVARYPTEAEARRECLGGETIEHAPRPVRFTRIGPNGAPNYHVVLDGKIVGRVERTSHSGSPMGKTKRAAVMATYGRGGITVWYGYDPDGTQLSRRYTRDEATRDLLAELARMP